MVAEAWLLAKRIRKPTNLNRQRPNVEIGAEELRELGVIVINVNFGLLKYQSQ